MVLTSCTSPFDFLNGIILGIEKVTLRRETRALCDCTSRSFFRAISTPPTRVFFFIRSIEYFKCPSVSENLFCAFSRGPQLRKMLSFSGDLNTTSPFERFDFGSNSTLQVL